MKSNLKTLFLSPEAQDDLTKIVAYTEITWGEKQAHTYQNKLFEGLQILLEHPEIGRAVDYILSGYRIWQVEKHFAIYRPEEERIAIIRILHVNADILAYFD